MRQKTDSQLLKEIQYEIDNEPVLKGTEIRVKVVNGIVTITGSVDRLFKKISVSALVIKLDGIVEFENRISIRPLRFLKNLEFEPAISNFDIADNKLTTSGA